MTLKELGQLMTKINKIARTEIEANNLSDSTAFAEKTNSLESKIQHCLDWEECGLTINWSTSHNSYILEVE